MIIKGADQQILVDILAEQAANDPISPQEFFKNLVGEANLTNHFKLEITGIWTGQPIYDAHKLVIWANAKGINPQDPQYTTLGSILSPLLEKVGLDIRQKIVAIIVVYQLYLSKNLLNNLVLRYQVPLPVEAHGTHISEVGPKIDWEGPEQQSELQSWNHPAPNIIDIGFLTRGISQAASVCRIEIPEANPRGTGFLIGKTLVLTNYHVLNPDNSNSYGEFNIEQCAQNVTFRFGDITALDGSEEKGQVFKTASGNAAIKASNPNHLDYVLLRVEDRISGVQGIKPATYTLASPYKGMSLNILQHPEGKTLKLALSGNGVDQVVENRGIVQYSTKTENGSSGSPCFNDQWEVIALHHAQSSRSFGTIGEGIIFKSIYNEIANYLQ